MKQKGASSSILGLPLPSFMVVQCPVQDSCPVSFCSISPSPMAMKFVAHTAGSPRCTPNKYLGSKVHPQRTAWIVFLKNHVSLALMNASVLHCSGRGRAPLIPAFYLWEDFHGKNNFFLREQYSEVVKMGKSEAPAWAFRNSGVSPSFLQFLTCSKCWCVCL